MKPLLRISRIVPQLLLSGIVSLFAVPIVWMVCAAFKQQDDLYTSTFLPWGHLERLTLANFTTLFAREPFARWFVNAVFVSSLQTVLVVITSCAAGFALAKYRFRGRRFALGVILGTMLLPFQVLLPSGFVLMRQIGWLNSYAAVIVPGAVSSFGTLLFMAAMRTVPDELLQAGRIDGCSELRLWWEIATPMLRPMIAAYTLLSFVTSWNSYIWPATMLQNEAKYTLPVGLANMTGSAEYASQYGILMAGVLVAVLPLIVLFLALQREFLGGLTAGALKG